MMKAGRYPRKPIRASSEVFIRWPRVDHTYRSSRDQMVRQEYRPLIKHADSWPSHVKHGVVVLEFGQGEGGRRWSFGPGTE